VSSFVGKRSLGWIAPAVSSKRSKNWNNQSFSSMFCYGIADRFIPRTVVIPSYYIHVFFFSDVHFRHLRIASPVPLALAGFAPITRVNKRGRKKGNESKRTRYDVIADLDVRTPSLRVLMELGPNLIQLGLHKEGDGLCESDLLFLFVGE
jgi:hypothetical protein